MTTTRRVWATGSLGLAFYFATGGACAQTSQTVVVDAGVSGMLLAEPAITSSLFNTDEVLVGWQRLELFPTGLNFWAASLNGGLSFTPPAGFQPPSDCGLATPVSGADSMVARSQLNDDLWYGTLIWDGDVTVPSLAVARRPAGATVLQNYAALHACPSADKGFLAVGPWPSLTNAPEAGEVMYCGYSTASTSPLWTNKSTRTGPTGAYWSNTPAQVTSGAGGTHRSGLCAFPVVTPDGALLLAYTAGHQYTSLPEVARSAAGGGAGNWSQGEPLNKYGLPPETDIFPMAQTLQLLNIPIGGGILPNSAPSMDYDPTDPSSVVVVFTGRTDSNQLPPTGNTLDLFVAHGTEGGANFEPDRIYRLTDDRLRLPGDPVVLSDEWQPSIGISAAGTVMIMFSRTDTPYTQTDPNLVQVRTRVAVWSTLVGLTSGAAPTSLFDLPAPGTSTPAVSRGFGGGPSLGRFNDYQMVTVASCFRAYAAWTYSPFFNPTGQWNICVTRIDLPCE